MPQQTPPTRTKETDEKRTARGLKPWRAPVVSAYHIKETKSATGSTFDGMGVS